MIDRMEEEHPELPTFDEASRTFVAATERLAKANALLGALERRDSAGIHPRSDSEDTDVLEAKKLAERLVDGFRGTSHGRVASVLYRVCVNQLALFRRVRTLERDIDHLIKEKENNHD